LLLPSPDIAGGEVAKAIASLIDWNAPLSVCATVAADRSAPRSLQSLSVMNTSAAFSPAPAKLKPLIATTRSTASLSRTVLSIASTDSSVRDAVASAGPWTCASRVP